MVVVGDTGLRVLSLSLLLLLSSTLQLHTAPARRPSTTPSTSTIQAVDFSTAFLCTRELKSQVVPSRVENFIQVSSHALALQVRTLDGQKWVELVWDNLASRCNLGVAPPPGKELMSYTFSAQLRSLVKGLNVIDVALAKPFERIIVISLGPRLNEAATHRIYVEIMSSRSNVILTQVDASEETVLCCAYQVSPSKSVRPIAVGHPYKSPPALTGRIPTLEESQESFVGQLARVPSEKLKKAMVGCYQGVSPSLASAMAAAVGLKGTMNVGDITTEGWIAIYEGPWRRWLKLIYSEEQMPLPIRLTGNGSTYAPFPLDDSNEASPAGENPSIGLFLSKYYNSRQGSGAFNSLHQRCMSRISATLVKLRERVADFAAQLEASGEDQVAELNMRGDLLTTYGHSWSRGDPFVSCLGFETGEEVKLAVDPEVSPIEAAQQAYKKAKKLRRGAEVLRGLLGQAESQVAYAESIFVALDQLEGTDGDIEVLREIASELGIQGEQVSGSRYLDAFGTKQVQAGGDSNMYAKNVKNVGRGKKKAQQQKSGSAAQGKNQRKNLLDGILQMQRTTDSSTVLVGRSNIQNERITFSIAKDHELWFHARGVAGSHVLLRAQPGQDADPDDIQFAADLAVYYSKAREGSEVPVDCISPKRIRKMGSAGPGMVWYEEAKVMWGNPKRIRELIASIHVGL